MKRRFPIFLLLIATVFPPLSARGESGEALAAVEAAFLELANRARRAPLEMAVSLGLDPERVLADVPELADVLTGGLPPLSADDRLRASAQSHVRDMIDRGYFDEVSPEGQGPLDRAVAAGYPAGTADESLGMLAFLNFMEPAVAAERIFANMFLDEIRPDENGPLRILNPDFRDVGVGFGSRQSELDGRTFNIYLAALDFGATLVEDLSMDDAASAFVRLVNQARTMPLAVGAAMGYDSEAMAIEHPVPGEALPPVRLNPALVERARRRLNEMYGEDNVFALWAATDGETVAETAGSEAPEWMAPEDVFGHRAVQIPADGVGFFSDVAQALFESLFRAERDSLSRGDALLLRPEAREFGFAAGRVFRKIDGVSRPFYAAAFEFGAGRVPSTPRVLATFFRDENGDGLYAPGEGIPGFGFEVVGYDSGIFASFTRSYGLLLTDGAGGITLEAFPGDFVLRSDFGEGPRNWRFRVGENDLFFPVVLDGGRPDRRSRWEKSIGLGGAGGFSGAAH
ncbi:MAG: CAP domain-containing protein [Thermodesulfobacteriota bacterium]